MRVSQGRVLLSCGLAAWVAGAAAQTTPGAVGDSLKRQPALSTPAPSAVQAPPASATPAASTAKGGKTVAVQYFQFFGNSLFDSDVLRAITLEYEGRNLTLLEIYEAADKVTSFYVAEGFTLASVNVPPQKIDDGIVRLEVIEGVVGAVTIQGAKSYKSKSVAGYLNAVKPGNIYRGSALTESLSLLNDLPGLRTRAILRPGSDLGVSDVVIQATEDPFSAFISVDNHGRENIGELRVTGGATINNPLRIGDQLQLVGLISEEALLAYGYVSYSLPVNKLGTRLALSYGEAQFELDEDFVDGVDGENRTARAELSHSFIRTPSDRLGMTLGVSYTKANADLFGLRLPGDTDLTLAEIGATLLHIWPNSGATQISLGASSNFQEGTANELAEPGRRDHQLFRGELDFLHLHALPQRFQLLARVAGAFSPEDALPDTQQFSLGGPASVRGYPSSEARGDTGIFGSLTLRRPFALGPIAAMASVFADGGRVERYELPPGVDNFDSLSSVGAGLDLSYRRFSAKLEGAAPLENRAVSDGEEDFRFFASTTVSF